MPAPPTDLFTSAYERGSQAEFITGATATTGFTQTGQARPASSKAYGIVPAVRAGVLSSNIALQADINRDAGTGAFSALSWNLLASLDGVSYYVVATFTDVAGGYYQFAGIVAHYFSVSLTTATVGSGAPQVTISMAA